MQDYKTKKKKLLSAILKDLESVLHNAIEMGMTKNLNPYEMILISVQTLQNNSKKNKPILKPVAKILEFPKAKKDRVSDPLFDGLNRDKDGNNDDDKNGA